MSLAQTLDPGGLLPPQPPPQTHREERLLLPPFQGGDAASRLSRAREYLGAVRAGAEARHRAGRAGFSVCRLLAEGLDRLVRGVYRELAAELRAPEELALVALGGYGRRETSPFSDVDLLLLRPSAIPEEEVRPFAQAFHTLLWDLRLTVGWAVRSPQECAREAEADHTVRTALLDARRLEGSEAAFGELAGGAIRELLTRRADAFIAEKIRELRLRREKYGDTLYLLEPNVKAGEGGLRDLEAALWIAQARYRTKGLRELLHSSVLPASEVALLTAARDFLMRIRNHLHFVRGRKEDRLTFELQEEVARFLGYADSAEGLGVERFMRHYYLSAKAIRRAADALIARCEELSASRPPPERRLGPFKTFRGKLTVAEGAPVEDPALWLRLFRAADEEQLPIYSYARDQVFHALPALEKARGAKEVVAELKAILCRPGTRGQAVWEMHELGVLGAVVPEFGRITARHQHDLYHVYTVDIHSLFALRRLYALREGDLQQAEPELSREMAALEDPLPLYLATLLHDAGKGMGGGHAQRGRELAASLGERLGLTPRQREICEFLVLHHLLLSQTAQRRDLSDPELIAQFAAQAGDLERLNALYLLTYADMSSVAPGTWNEWRARLVRELYAKAKGQLLGAGPSEPGARAAFAERWRRAFGEDAAQALSRRLPERYFLSAPPSRATLDARLLRRAREDALAAFLRAVPSQGTSELSLCTRDRPGLLSQLAGVLSAHGIDILRAQIASTDDGFALDVFDVRGPGGRVLERVRWRAARADLRRVVQGAATAEEVLRKRRKSALLERRLPKVPTRVSVDNQASRRFSVVDVRAEDRVGLLYRIARAMKDAGAEIALAAIATEAHQAVDSFYVTRSGERITDPEQVAQLARRIEEAISAEEPA